MADIQSHDPLGKSAGQPGSTKPQASSGGSAIADQARETLRTATDRASETWDDVSKRGTDYYRQGSRLVGDADSATLASLFIAGGIGFGIGWLVFGQHSRSGDYVARRMSHSSERDH
ncbi:MAG: hypothetical protein K2Y56_24955 [Methylobacterium sp.]|uniref:hypothetical protein n=1 Tax=Methylobacterium sp. TaxID=409 RepID=UPI0025DF8F19|nr:hypothetical protein [Methylobacterium sp.]MBX9934722.1 hypothetical protein [Methylobacterium sp.]